MLLRRDRALMAIDIVLDVAFHAGRGAEATGAAGIAERLGAQRRGIEPVLQALSRAAILEGMRGPKGGYRLARAPRGIALMEIIEAVVESNDAFVVPNGRLAEVVTAVAVDKHRTLVISMVKLLTAKQIKELTAPLLNSFKAGSTR